MNEWETEFAPITSLPTAMPMPVAGAAEALPSDGFLPGGTMSRPALRSPAASGVPAARPPAGTLGTQIPGPSA